MPRSDLNGTAVAISRNNNRDHDRDETALELRRSNNNNNNNHNETEIDTRRTDQGRDERAVDIPKDEEAEEDEEDDDYDPWAVVDPPDHTTPFKERTLHGKVNFVLKKLLLLCLVLAFLYFFICSLSFLTNAFRLLGGELTGEAFSQNEVLTNPICDLMMGIIATVCLQSSSTVTSITVTMVASKVLPIRPAVFIVMGANIGTSVTNTLVALGQAGNPVFFQRAFGGAVVHDMFNWCAVLVLLPIEWISGSFGSWKGCGLLCQITGAITNTIRKDEDYKQTEILHVITWPFIHRFIWIDYKKMIKKIKDIATWNETAQGSYPNYSIMMTCYEPEKLYYIGSENDSCVLMYNETMTEKDCGYLFEGLRDKWDDRHIGILVLVFAIIVLFSCLGAMVKTLQVLMRGSVARILKKSLNSDLPCGRAGQFLTGYLAIIFGAGTTMVIQSSSVFTSTLTPLVGCGILHIKRMYPLTLGANLGTTLTAIVVSLALDDGFADGLQIALCHLFFNFLGILIWYPVPFMRKIPISLAKKLGEKTGKHRWFAGVYIVGMFLLFPGSVFLLSLAGWEILLGIAGPIFLLFVFVVIISVMQRKCAGAIICRTLRNWNFLPLWLHSLMPYDKIFAKLCFCNKVCGHCSSHAKKNQSHDNVSQKSDTEVYVVNERF